LRLVGRVMKQVSSDEPVLLFDGGVVLGVATPWYLRIVVVIGPLRLRTIVSSYKRILSSIME
jgi:hypothetical protein